MILLETWCTGSVEERDESREASPALDKLYLNSNDIFTNEIKRIETKIITVELNHRVTLVDTCWGICSTLYHSFKCAYYSMQRRSYLLYWLMIQKVPLTDLIRQLVHIAHASDNRTDRLISLCPITSAQSWQLRDLYARWRWDWQIYRSVSPAGTGMFTNDTE